MPFSGAGGLLTVTLAAGTGKVVSFRVAADRPRVVAGIAARSVPALSQSEPEVGREPETDATDERYLQLSDQEPAL